MILEDLRRLTPGDRVLCRCHGGVAIGRVNAADELCVEIWWADGTSSLVWFAHCADGRDPRHELLFRAKPESASRGTTRCSD